MAEFVQDNVCHMNGLAQKCVKVIKRRKIKLASLKQKSCH